MFQTKILVQVNIWNFPAHIFGSEFDVVLVKFVLLALFPRLSVSVVFWFCIILSQINILIRRSDNPSCCVNSVRLVTSEVCQKTVNRCTPF
jgi:hypothetical protein